ncbi:MAG: SH3 domain-containing protein, partial [Chloroflexota bacterium]|nr:SH3 domain-containing protein [Chloroflexota bacterium]
MLTRGCHPVCRLLVGAVVVALTCGPLSMDVAAQDGAPIIASGGEVVLLRDAPGWDAAAVSELADGSALQITGDAVSAPDGSLWSPVSANGATGYVPAGYVGAGSTEAVPVHAAPVETEDAWAPEAVEMASDPALADVAPVEAAPVVSQDPVVAQDPIMAPAAPVGAATMTDANLRTGPSADASIMQVLPPGTPLTVDGAAQNGFVPVTGGGTSGWIAEQLLAQQAEPVALDPTLAVPDASVDPAVADPALAAPATDSAT